MVAKVEWEYDFVSLKHEVDRIQYMNERGADGWEIISVDIDYGLWFVLMKRRKK